MSEMKNLFSEKEIQHMDSIFTERKEFFDNHPSKEKEHLNKKGFFNSLSLGDPETYTKLFTETRIVNGDSTYRANQDILYIDFKNEEDTFDSLELKDGVILYINENYFPQRLKVFNASKKFNVPKISITRGFEFRMNLSVNQDTIKIVATFIFKVRNQDIHKICIPYSIPNDSNIPSLNQDFVSSVA